MMKIKLFDHPFSPTPQVYEVESLAHWLLERYGEKPSVRVQIFKGEPCAEKEISHDANAILAGDSDEYVVLQSPGGGETLLYAVLVGVVVAAVVLMPKPVMPGNVNRTQQSPNNALSNRENKVRLLERVEDIYGTVKAIPSLMMPTYIKYIGHRKYEYGYYCVGRGYHDITELRDGDTLIADIDGASAAVYDPFTSPNSGDSPALLVGAAIIDNVLTASRAIEVDGITLKALNQVQLPVSASYTYTPNADGDIITQVAKQPNFNAVAAVGDTLTVSMSNYVATMRPSGDSGSVSTSGTSSYVGTGGFEFTDIRVGDSVTVAGFTQSANNGTFTVTAKPNAYTITVSSSSLVAESSGSATFSVTRNYSGTYTIAAVNDGSVTLTTATWKSVIPASNGFGVPITSSIAVNGKTEYTDWVTLPDADRTEVWCNVVAPSGMFKDNGGKSVAAVDFAIEIEKLNGSLAPLGIVETVTGTLSGAVSDERADTIEHATAWTGPVRVRMRRTSNYDYGFNGTVMDEIKWADLYSVSPVTKTEFGNKTTIHTITQATSRATAVKTRQLNCIASRRLPTYNGSAFSGAFDAEGRHVSGTISATSKLVDIVAAVASDPKIGRRNLATEVDMAQIWGIQQQLDAWNPECGQFNYTFDTDNMSFEETVIAIANAGFCIAYRQNGKIRLALDRAQANSTALFTHRNKKPNSESITRKFASDSEYDGVEFVYVDPDTHQSETIKLPLDGSFTKLKKFEIPGIRSFAQAWLRANRECQKLIGQRITIETTTTLDARALLPNSRVDIVDNTRFKSYDGEVIAQNGLELTLSQDVAFTSSLPHSIVLMRRDGSLQSIAVTAGSTPNKVVLQNMPSEAIVTTYGQGGIRTIYSFAADSARGAQEYLVQELDMSDGQYVTIRAINYSDDYYQYDNAPIPDKDTVIN
ncbi:host specificity factor TipJ family phage tail protein [Noviherbaspirillum autotrophicum]|uniref:Tip attachment protein J domain-containing protein n=1 Tax=Noviherbaspirillum autotrophicum TaxID=709839 RepID=A0A0C2BHR8_9BURK|nr:host specificity factor TipJ family phage tail protein [Noviherbaspirillum autotrophicum]KIF80770.1 hypothetical protein TSA66_07965 [Noviherbaspirillum autotrophicum]KIF80807.1 hypothetical protein TSA66_08210 [Noviherbaspirillum autotrophicum]KIF84032.1 hypothetical protein TSA66_00900 [Noviherbaspirillum autotrophicum]